METIIRYRYNTMAHETPRGDWKWRVVLENGGGFEEVLVTQLYVNVPSFSRADEMPVVGRKYHRPVAGCSGRRTASGPSTRISAPFPGVARRSIPIRNNGPACSLLHLTARRG